MKRVDVRIHDHQSLLNDWFKARCALVGEHSGDIGRDVSALHGEAVEYARQHDLIAPEVPSYYVMSEDFT